MWGITDLKVGDILVGVKPRTYFIYDVGYEWEVLNIYIDPCNINTRINVKCVKSPFKGDGVGTKTTFHWDTYSNIIDYQKWFKIYKTTDSITPLSKLINKIYEREKRRR